MLFILHGVFALLATTQFVLVVLPYPLGLTSCDLGQKKNLSDAALLDFTPFKCSPEHPGSSMLQLSLLCSV